MKRTVIDCDKCGKECKHGSIDIAVPNGTNYHFDGVESNVDFLYEEKQLCPECAEALLRFLFAYLRRGSIDLVRAAGRQHPGPKENDAIRLALKFFGIKEKE
jgi:hypothetical protein